METNQVLLELENIDKRFGGVHALNDVSFSVNRGEVHAIVGENGAGKSTLMKILAGSYQPDQGKIRLNAEDMFFSSPRDSYAAGINIIYQEFYKFPALSVIANIFAGRELTNVGILNEKEMRARAEEVFKKLELEINLDQSVKNLSIAHQQLVEVAKALVYEGSLLIMDEPNSSLTDKETESLFKIIRLLKDQGITVLYVSHRLEEVFKICDRITIMRDGKYIGTWETSQTNIPFVISQMIGHSLENTFPPLSHIPSDAQNIINVIRISKKNCLDNVSFQAVKGEVVGFTGIEGSGIRDLFHILFGMKMPDTGEIEFLEKKYKPRFSSDAIQMGWGMIPSNRRDHGLFLRWSLKENFSIVILEKLLNFFGLISEGDLTEITNSYVKKLNISTDSVDKKVFDLSGGNQQKVVLAKWLATNPKILILDDPTRGIDVGAKSEIYQLIRELSQKGITVLLSSSEIEEVLYLSHRVLIMRNGKIIKEFSNHQVDKAEVMRYVSGDLLQQDLELTN